MSIFMNRAAYENLIREDIDWLKSCTYNTAERKHIIRVLAYSVYMHYGEHSELEQLAE